MVVTAAAAEDGAAAGNVADAAAAVVAETTAADARIPAADFHKPPVQTGGYIVFSSDCFSSNKSLPISSSAFFLSSKSGCFVRITVTIASLLLFFSFMSSPPDASFPIIL
jgi:hypothetical protein